MFIIGLLLGVFAVIFALQNTAIVTVTFFHYQIVGSLAPILLLAVVIGAMISVLLSIPGAIHKNTRVRSLSRHNQKLAEELDAHKELIEQSKNAEIPRVVERTMIVDREV